MARKLTDFEAITIAEEHMGNDHDQRSLQAWSHIGKKGLYLVLQGKFGRELHRLIQSGLLKGNFDINEDVLNELV